MSFQRRDRGARGALPYSRRAIVADGGDELTVVAEQRLLNWLRVTPQHRQQLSGPRTPDARGVIVARGDEVVAVGRELRRDDKARMAGERRLGAAALDAP